jgi:membrane-associated phospholipid phosphatase
MLILNLLVVASTLTTGWHYGNDVAGGILVAVFAASVTHRLRPWLRSEFASDDANGHAVPANVWQSAV